MEVRVSRRCRSRLGVLNRRLGTVFEDIQALLLNVLHNVDDTRKPTLISSMRFLTGIPSEGPCLLDYRCRHIHLPRPLDLPSSFGSPTAGGIHSFVHPRAPSRLYYQKCFLFFTSNET